MLLDHDGDAANYGTGFGKPAKDLSINFVPVPYPDYPPAVIKCGRGAAIMACAECFGDYYLNLAVLFKHAPQPLGFVAWTACREPQWRVRRVT